MKPFHNFLNSSLVGGAGLGVAGTSGSKTCGQGVGSAEPHGPDGH